MSLPINNLESNSAPNKFKTVGSTSKLEPIFSTFIGPFILPLHIKNGILNFSNLSSLSNVDNSFISPNVKPYG